jgi:hypothetical protein
MNRYDKALQSLQPNLKDIVRTFLLDTNFGDTEYRRYMEISFTIDVDRHLGYRRLALVTYKNDFNQALFHDADIVKFKAEKAPDIPVARSPEGEVVKQTLENVMKLIDSTPILHIITISMKKFHIESDVIYNWRELSELAIEASKDRTLSIK